MAVGTAQRVRVTLDRTQIAAQITTGPSSKAVRAVTRTTARALTLAKLKTPVDTGRLRAANAMDVQVTADAVTGRLTNDLEYAVPVHEGYQKRLRGGGVLTVYGQPWMAEALQEATGVDFGV